MPNKPLVVTPRAARWLHALVHTPGIGISLADLDAAKEAVAAIDAYVAKLPMPPTLEKIVGNGKTPPDPDRGARR